MKMLIAHQFDIIRRLVSDYAPAGQTAESGLNREPVFIPVASGDSPGKTRLTAGFAAPEATAAISFGRARPVGSGHPIDLVTNGLPADPGNFGPELGRRDLHFVKLVFPDSYANVALGDVSGHMLRIRATNISPAVSRGWAGWSGVSCSSRPRLIKIIMRIIEQAKAELVRNQEEMAAVE